jgi:hypothetical protein
LQPDPRPPSDCWVPTGATADGCQGPNEHEPNDDVSHANRVADATCADQSISGQASNGVDYFRTFGPRCNGQKPTVKLQPGADPSLVYCLFVSCKYGRTGRTNCSNGATMTHLPEGILGCCSTGPGSFDVDMNCDGDFAWPGVPSPSTIEHDVTATLVVDGSSASGSGCSSYEIAYHF